MDKNALIRCMDDLRSEAITPEVLLALQRLLSRILDKSKAQLLRSLSRTTTKPRKYLRVLETLGLEFLVIICDGYRTRFCKTDIDGINAIIAANEGLKPTCSNKSVATVLREGLRMYGWDERDLATQKTKLLELIRAQKDISPAQVVQPAQVDCASGYLTEANSSAMPWQIGHTAARAVTQPNAPLLEQQDVVGQPGDCSRFRIYTPGQTRQVPQPPDQPKAVNDGRYVHTQYTNAQYANSQYAGLHYTLPIEGLNSNMAPIVEGNMTGTLNNNRLEFNMDTSLASIIDNASCILGPLDDSDPRLDGSWRNSSNTLTAP
ncbi:hypothetical protein BDV97DRAFT_204704 [Delphinella strobiligena]|nr:hypothetical protein BDV97DRAFT_204704 [Delphinella strobiligena]